MKKKRKIKKPNPVQKNLYQFNQPKVEESGKVFRRKEKHKREEETNNVIKDSTTSSPE